MLNKPNESRAMKNKLGQQQFYVWDVHHFYFHIVLRLFSTCTNIYSSVLLVNKAPFDFRPRDLSFVETLWEHLFSYFIFSPPNIYISYIGLRPDKPCHFEPTTSNQFLSIKSYLAVLRRGACSNYSSSVCILPGFQMAYCCLKVQLVNRDLL